ncbi:MAG: zf-TFIIB domain-containing protein [Acidimicrobiia bacterium]|nr:zf-TFIIB domain-containing protein [Acidimicrobiia bacterium]MDH5421161.1 zf-TFIIB domain-containing protein [Acidimicrobiia bacterium]MDH5503084.1 zf-TFIIB domain-containing protein [Acidimicrobiia bacterium]
MNCPRCDIILIPTHATGNRYECPRCNGRLSNSNDIGLLLSFATRNELVRAAAAEAYQGLACPFCGSSMNPVELTHRLGVMEVDVCNPCVALWTDPGEITKLSQSSVGSAPGRDVGEMNPDLPMAMHRRSVTSDAKGTATHGLLNLLVELFTTKI